MTTAVINNMEQDGPAVVKIVGNGSVVECFHERPLNTEAKQWVYRIVLVSVIMRM